VKQIPFWVDENALFREIKHWNVSAAGGVHSQNCTSETAKNVSRLLHGVFVSVFYFKCATAEIKYCFISVLFQLCGHHKRRTARWSSISIVLHELVHSVPSLLAAKTTSSARCYRIKCRAVNCHTSIRAWCAVRIECGELLLEILGRTSLPHKESATYMYNQCDLQLNHRPRTRPVRSTYLFI